MSTKVQRRSASPVNRGRHSDDKERSPDASPMRGNKKNKNQRDLSPEQTQRNLSGRSKQQLPLAGFWPQLQQQASTVLSSLRASTRYLKTPMLMLKNHLYAAVSIAIFSVLVGGAIMGYSAYQARQNQGFIPRVKNAAQRAGYATMDAFDSVRHSGEGYLDKTLHGIEETTTPIKDAFLHAKDRVAEATGFSHAKPEGVIDSAKHHIEDFASSLKTNAANVAHNAYDAAAHAAQATRDAAMHAADATTKKGEELTAAAKKKAEELTGMTQQKREELAIKTKKNVDIQSVAAKKKIDDAATAAKKATETVADATKKAADKAAGKSGWTLW
jgi:hypothetical protein